MRRKKLLSTRNKLNLADPKQSRLVRKRLRLSEAELTQIVERSGNSIAAISKEAALQRAKQLPPPTRVPAAAVIASAASEPTAATEPAASNEPTSSPTSSSA